MPKNLDTPTHEIPPDVSDTVRHDMRKCFRASELLRPLTLFLPRRQESGRRRWALAFSSIGLILLMLGVTCQTPLLLLLMTNQLKYQQKETGSSSLSQSNSDPNLNVANRRSFDSFTRSNSRLPSNSSSIRFDLDQNVAVKISCSWSQWEPRDYAATERECGQLSGSG